MDGAQQASAAQLCTERMEEKMRYVLLLAVVLLCACTTAQAATYTWDFSNQGDYWLTELPGCPVWQRWSRHPMIKPPCSPGLVTSNWALELAMSPEAVSR